MTHRARRAIEPESRVNGRIRRNGRRHRVRVRIQTDAETYVGCLLLSGGHTGLDELLNDGRAYLALRDATPSGSTAPEQLVALHKGSIRSILVLGPLGREPRASSGR